MEKRRNYEAPQADVVLLGLGDHVMTLVPLSNGQGYLWIDDAFEDQGGW